MPDGRKRNNARTTASITLALAMMALGVATAAPAVAAPADDLDSAQSRVDRLARKAEVAEARHDKTRGSLEQTRKQHKRVATQLRRQQQLMTSLREQVAKSVVEDHAGSAARTQVLSPESRLMLSNVTLVSEQVWHADQLRVANELIGELTGDQAGLRTRMKVLASREKDLRGQSRASDGRLGKAASVLADLEAKAEAKRIAAIGGPAVAYAKAQVGKAYVWGAAGPNSFDCSGLTMAAYAQAGISLPHNSQAQYNSGRRISESELRPGDLVFYYSPISHVGIYVGDGQVVNALNPGSGVQVSGLHDMPYVGAVRPG